jgi:hypothetical protein
MEKGGGMKLEEMCRKETDAKDCQNLTFLE